MLETIKTVSKEGIYIRKRSFQAIPIKVVHPVTVSLEREVAYGEITEMSVNVGEFHKSIRLDLIVEEIRLLARESRDKDRESSQDKEGHEVVEDLQYPSFTDFLSLTTV